MNHFWAKLLSIFVSIFFLSQILLPNLNNSANAAVGINPQINFQGKLVNPTTGVNVTDGSGYEFVFSLYNGTGGAIWTETHTGVTVSNGIYRVALGSISSLTSVNFNRDDVYLGVQVTKNAAGAATGDAEMSPRIRFTATPYAFNSTKVNGLTVTNTSDAAFSNATALKLTDGKTVIFNGGTNALTLTTTGDSTLTLPSGTETLVGRASLDTLTNKTIAAGSNTITGLTNMNLSGSAGITSANLGTDISTTNLASTLTFANADYIDLGAITHSTTAQMGLRLPNVSSATPSLPTGGLKGFLAYDTAGNQLIAYNGSAWAAVGGSGGSSVWSALTAPVSDLSLVMSTNKTIFNWATGTSSNNLFSLTTDASSNGTGALLNLQTGTSSTVLPLRVRAGSVEGLMVDASGDVGIGTTDPGAKLEVKGSSNATQFIITANGTQSNTNPLMLLQKSDGTDLLSLHSDDSLNIFLGLNTGRVNDPSQGGLENIFIGNSAGYQNVDGSSNVLLGSNAGYNNTTGSSNVVIGTNAGYGSVGSLYSGNTLVGSFSGMSLTTGDYNVLFGNNAGNNLTTGSNNIAIGSVDLPSATADNQLNIGNIIFGTDIDGFGSTLSTGNIGIGLTNPGAKLEVKGSADATQFIITANGTQSNTNPLMLLQKSDGTDLLSLHSDDTTNIFLGLNAGRVNDYSFGAIANTFIGQGAGYANNYGNHNTLLGYQAGYANTSGNNNILLGSYAGDNLTNGSNNIMLGYGIDAPSATGSNQLSIGNLIFGNGVDGTGTTLSTGKVGIGVANPSTYKLEVNGTGGFSTSVNSPIFQGQAAGVTFGNNSYTSAINGSTLSITPTSWTATPTISGLITASGGLTTANNNSITVNASGGTGKLAINSTVTGTNDAFLINPSYASTTTSQTYNLINLAGFSPTNSTGTNNVNGIFIGNMTDPGATITSSALNIGNGWENDIYFEKGTNDVQFRVTAPSASRIYTLPDFGANDSFVGLAASQTLTNKTLTTPVIASISNSGTITVPTGTDTLIGKNTTDILTNKSIAAGSNTITGLTNSNLSGSAGITSANLGTDISATNLAATLSFSNGDYIDLSAVTHGSTAQMGLRLPNAASATPSSPTGGGKGYLAYDTAGNQLIVYNGSSWSAVTGGGGGPFTDGTGITYLTDTAEDFALGGITQAAATFFVDVSAGMVYLGKDQVTNGGLTFYSSGAGETDPFILAEADGDLSLSAPTGTVNVGSGTGNITMSLTNSADIFNASKTLTLGANYSSTIPDFTFNRTFTGNFTQTGSVVSITDTSSSNTTMNHTLLLVNAAPTLGTYTGSLLKLQVGGSDRLSVANTGVLTLIGGNTTDILSSGTNTLKIDTGGAAGLSFGTANANAITIGRSGITTTVDSGLTLTTGRTLTINTDAFTDLTGNGLSVSSNALTLNLTTSGTTGSTSSNSGLEVSSSGLTLLKGCADGQILKYTDAGGWACQADEQGGGSTGSSNWTLNTANGTLSPNNNTADVLFGGNSTASATLKINQGGGTEPILKVGNETTRGNIDVYGDVVKKGLMKQYGITNINDVYIYDTTTDSNNGAWRDSTVSQNLSWYTEIKDDGEGDICNISTDDRCGVSEFPQKAIIVASDTALYIFNAGDMKLWMKFTQGGTFALGADLNNNPSSVFAINGVMYVGTNGSAGTGLYALDFVTDRMYKINTSNRIQGDKNISNRNTTLTYATDVNTQYTLVDNIVNDVHGNVIQGSGSTNPQNGNTLIAVATDTGITVINMTNPQSVSYSDVTGDDYNAIWVTKRARLYAMNETQAQLEKWLNIDIDQVNELNGTPDKVWDETAANYPNISKSVFTVPTSPDTLSVIERTSMSDDASDTVYVGTSNGLAVLQTNTAETAGWVKYYTKDYITEQQIGAAKAMWPMNEASGNIVDASRLNNTLAAKGTPTYGVNGVRGTALTYNNSTTHLCSDANADSTCDNDTDFNVGTTQFIISAWVKHSTTAPASGVDVIMSKRHTTAPAAVAGWEMYMDTAGRIGFAVDDDATWGPCVPATDDCTISTNSYNDNQWHHVMAAKSSSTAGIYLYIDGKLINSDTTINSTLTLDGAGAILGVGSDCSVGAACATGANFWDGQIDDIMFSTENVTSANLSIYARRLHQEGRAASQRKTISVIDATTVSTTTIGDSAETWIPNEFVGSFVEITGGTGVGQTRKIVANTTTTMTVSPAWTTTPNTTSDFQVNPEELYGNSNVVEGIGIADVFTGEHRKVFVGTNDGIDGGGVTSFNNVGFVHATDAYHADAKKVDDASSEWTGTDYDDVQAIADTNGVIAFGSLGALWSETDTFSMVGIEDRLNHYMGLIRIELRHDGLGGLSPEVGYIPGADLAENYYSNDLLLAGEVVSIDASRSAGVKKSSKPYQKDILGIVATQPGIVLGPKEENSYPIALVGRVPVRVTTENGIIKAGDRITSSTKAGYAMKATQSGRVLGTVLEDVDTETLVECPDEEVSNTHRMCGVALVFVNLTDYSGESIDVVMQNYEQISGGANTGEVAGIKTDVNVSSTGLENATQSIAFGPEEKIQEKVLAFLKEYKKNNNSALNSEIFTGKITALEITSSELFVDILHAKKIKADSIEGLEILTNRLGSLDEAVAKLNNVSPGSVLSASESASVIPNSIRDPNEMLNQVQHDKSLTLSRLNVEGIATISADLDVKGSGIVHGVLNVIETITARNLLVGGWADFMNAIFRGDVDFQGRPTFNKDTAGIAVIKKDADTVEVTFDKEYSSMPIVSASMAFEDVTVTEGTNGDEHKQSLEQKIFDQGYTFIISRKTTKSFIIRLNKPAAEDVTFSWTALSIKEAKKIQSSKSATGKSIPTPTPAKEVINPSPESSRSATLN